MILSTTSNIEGKTIREYCGLVSSEVIVGANVFKDIMSGIRDVVGGRSKTYERELQSARESALQELQRQAAQYKADAIIGIQFDFEVIGRNGSMLMVCISGTAVRFE